VRGRKRAIALSCTQVSKLLKTSNSQRLSDFTLKPFESCREAFKDFRKS
jgi:hypothetical protein